MLQRLQSGFIDVKRLIAELSDEELLRSADAYFATMTLASEQCRKPFSNPGDAIHLSRHLALVLDAAELFRGARVLDFGCATGWLTMGLAQMGCDAVGIDISPNALKLAEGLKASRAPALGGGTLDFKVYDGKRLPLDDESVDRIICYDAFHHVKDQRATIAEFARVLRRGGRVAFMEPGPNHSKTPQSQAEMAQFKVIENDVCMREIESHAAAVGFEAPEMLVQFAQPFRVPVGQFNRWADEDVTKEWGQQAIAVLSRQLTNGQCFYLYKPGGGSDSRQAESLGAELRLHAAHRVARAQGHGISLDLSVRNTGSGPWVAAGLAGQVNVGIQILGPAGDMLDNNFARLRLPKLPVEIGETVRVTGIVPWPKQPDFVLQLDMVSELVAWFSGLQRCEPLRIRAAELSA